MDPSKPKLSWDYDVGGGMNGLRSGNDAIVSELRAPVIPIPDREKMAKRWAFRQGIREETLQHRRIHKHGGIGATGRNIAFVLRDREACGAQRVIGHQPTIKTKREEASSTVECRPESKKQRQDDVGMSVGSPDSVITGGIHTETESERIDVQDVHAENGRMRDVGRNGETINTGSNSTSKDKEDQGIQNESKRDATSSSSPVLLPRVCYPMTVSHEIRTFAEYSSVVRYHSAFFHHLGGEDERGERGERPNSSRAVSTISIAFSPDSQTMASTHGDHTVKITCCSTGRLRETLEGHPRTPWTVKYHPTDPHIVASGCLGHQVRVWNWKEKACLQMIRLEFAIISLSFHPGGQILAIANGTRLHFWGYATNRETNNSNESSSQSTGNGTGSNRLPSSSQQDQQTRHHSQRQRQQQSRPNRGMLTEVEQRHMLRCVHFPPGGNTIIVGGVNPTSEDPRRTGRSGVSGGGMSFYLRLWDFDVDAALRPFGDNSGSGGPSSSSLGVRRRAISNPRTFVPRALLYNDGGFDVSPDGKTLCACAEYWLPEGVDNAMELLQQEERIDDDESDDEEEAEIPGEGDSDGIINDAGMASQSTTETGNANEKNGANASNVATTPTRGSTAAQAGEAPPASSRSQSPPRHRTPTQFNNAPTAQGNQLTPRTPPSRPHFTLSPPSPPGRRFTGGLNQRSRRSANNGGNGSSAGGTSGRGSGSGGGNIQPFPNPENQTTSATTIPPPPPPPPGFANRPPHPLSIISGGGANYTDVAHQNGRYVPHVVTISLDTTPVTAPVGGEGGSLAPGRGKVTSVARGYSPRLGQLLEACPLDGAKASAVTCVKFSPSTDFCLIGYGVREPVAENGGQYHPVTALYRIRGGMTHVSTMLSGDDDVNIARFHPDSGYGFVYGTKQGRVRVLSPRPWNYYNC